jgi:peptidylprolyl isomerase
MNYSKEKWIAVVAAVVVIGIFFGGMFAYNKQQGNGNNNDNDMFDQNQNDTNATSTEAQPPVTLAGGLIVQDIIVGTGPEVKTGDDIAVHYTGRLADGTVFDSSYNRGEPFLFKLGNGDVIPGWDRGLVGMKVGGIRVLEIPPSLAYGARGAGRAIPPNATLKFQVELLGVRQ